MDKQNNGMEIMREIGLLQLGYESLIKQKRLTKKAICDLVIPFKERYHLTDKEALAIARNELRIDEIVSVLEDAYKRAPVVLPTQQDTNKNVV